MNNQEILQVSGRVYQVYSDRPNIEGLEMIDDAKLIFTSLTTPDGTELVSRHRHDFVSYTDKNGKTYFIDGGTDYVRASCNGDESFFSITTDDEFEDIRKYLFWGTYGKEGTDPLKYVALKDMSTAHIEAVLNELTPFCLYEKHFIDELHYRKKLL